MMDRLSDEVQSNIDTLFERGITMSTHYSGMGSAECAAAFLLQARAQAHGGHNFKGIDFNHSCDTDPKCRKVLKAHSIESRSRHLFGDIHERVSPEVLEQLQQTQTRCNAELTRRTDAGEPLAKVYDELSTTLLRDMASILDLAEIKTTAWCYAHNRQCSTCDILPDMADSIRVHFSTPTCTEHSCMNKGAQGDARLHHCHLGHLGSGTQMPRGGPRRL